MNTRTVHSQNSQTFELLDLFDYFIPLFAFKNKYMDENINANTAMPFTLNLFLTKIVSIVPQYNIQHGSNYLKSKRDLNYNN